MHEDPPRSHVFGAQIVLGASMVALAIEPERLGAQLTGSSFDPFYWGIVLPGLALAGAFLALTSRSTVLRVLRAPCAPLLLGACWLALWSPVARRPGPAALTAIAVVLLLVQTTWFVHQLGWDLVHRILGRALLVVLAVSAVTQLLNPADGSRWSGACSSPNAFGLMGALSVATGASLLVRSRADMLGLVLAPLGAAAMLLADSRTAMAASALAVTFVLRRVVGRAAVPLLLLLCSALIAVSALSSNLQTTTVAVSRSGGSTEITTLTGRTDVWRVAVGAITDRPVIGHGYQGSVDVYSLALAEGRIAWNARTAHNVILQALVLGGVPYLLCILVALGGWLRTATAASVDSREALMLIILVNGMTESFIDGPWLVYLILGAVAASVVAQRARARPPATGAAGIARTVEPAVR